MFTEIDTALDVLMKRRNEFTGIASIAKIESIFEEIKIDISKIPIIHVAGTNGKGSTTNFMRSILQVAGYRVGTFTSPHLVSHHDRFRINNVPIPDDVLLRLINDTYDLWQKYDLRMFEIDTIIMFLYFIEEAVDVAIVEAGIGGRLDATNVVKPLLTVITNVSLDHMEVLGNTKELIAKEKAGIVKEGIPLVTSVEEPNLLEVLEQKCEQMHAPFIKTASAQNIIVEDNKTTFEYNGSQYSIPTVAQYQIKNACLSLQAIQTFQDLGYVRVTEENKCDGLKNTIWAGRFEQVLPQVYLDGAHNIAGMQALVDSLPHLQQPIHVVFSALKDKEVVAMLSIIGEYPAQLVITTFDFFKGTISEEQVSSFGKPFIADYKEAITQAKEAIEKDEGTLIITGSLYFISAARAFLLNN